MLARDVMTSPVITAKTGSSVKEVEKILLVNRISAVVVIDEAGQLAGIITKGDLMRFTERQHPRWFAAFCDEESLLNEYLKAHASNVRDVMMKVVITAAPDTPLDRIAALFEKHAIRRVPIVENGNLIGIVSRANLLQSLAADQPSPDTPLPDSLVRDKLLAHLEAQPWAHASLLNVAVHDGVVDLSGFTLSPLEKDAVRIAAENTPGVRAVNDKLVVQCW
jgi:CBS domain-containing protein